MFKYPIGPPSLLQVERACVTIRYRQIHGWDTSTDPIEVAIDSMARGIVPTFGHMDNNHARWYEDLWGDRTREIAINF
jgi:hypothetical protein